MVPSESDALISRALTLFPSDTVLAALQLMHRYGLSVLPVVDEARGELLGEVTEGELRRLWPRLPLARMAEILTAKVLAQEEEMTGGRWAEDLTPATRWVH
ncbi:CBS domain-containing protein [Myxococcaceae bacterium GXIMD 01537]